ncbi:MAG: N-acetylneuraminate synthase [Bacteroidales bacterium]|nr:N-acetylneuraminate synthase [Bacteroidales bacterium]
MDSHVFIIAEAGVNHNGSVETAKRMIDAATAAGADAVKFQTFRASALLTPYTVKAEYQKQGTPDNESQYQMLKRLELSEEDHFVLFDYCRHAGIEFISSPFDVESAELLNRIGVRIFKIPSGELTNHSLLSRVATFGKEIIMSSGMADMQEIERGLKVLTGAGMPKERITILHCNSAYPTPFCDANLRAIVSIRDLFKIRVGYSDHTIGIEVPIAAVALGATVIEKHFTLDRNAPGPDQMSSLEPDELKEMVRAIRNVEMSMGDGVKRVSPSEGKNRELARKRIVAKRDIISGEPFTIENVCFKRSNTGLFAEEMEKIAGKIAERNFSKDEGIII